MNSRTKNANSNKNALKTGAYSRDTLLPWESAAEFETHRADIFDDLQPTGKIQHSIASDIADNRWLRERQRRTTAIATLRHSFGRELEESGVSSWKEVLSFLSEREIEHRKLLRSMDESMEKIAATVEDYIKASEASDELEKYVRKILKGFEENGALLDLIATAVDDERDFFLEYSPKRLEQRIHLENALDAQYDKLRARFVIEKEARIVRDKMRKSEETADSSPSEQTVPKRDKRNVDEPVVSKVAADEPASEDELSDERPGLEDPDDETPSLTHRRGGAQKRETLRATKVALR
jgi:hypothetical protein